MLLSQHMTTKQTSLSARDLWKICNILVQTVEDLNFLKKYVFSLSLLVPQCCISNLVYCQSKVSGISSSPHLQLFCLDGNCVWLFSSPLKSLFCSCLKWEIVTIMWYTSSLYRPPVHNWYTTQQESSRYFCGSELYWKSEVYSLKRTGESTVPCGSPALLTQFLYNLSVIQTVQWRLAHRGW